MDWIKNRWFDYENRKKGKRDSRNKSEKKEKKTTKKDNNNDSKYILIKEFVTVEQLDMQKKKKQKKKEKKNKKNKKNKKKSEINNDNDNDYDNNSETSEIENQEKNSEKVTNEIEIYRKSVQIGIERIAYEFEAKERAKRRKKERSKNSKYAKKNEFDRFEGLLERQYQLKKSLKKYGKRGDVKYVEIFRKIRNYAYQIPEKPSNLYLNAVSRVTGKVYSKHALERMKKRGISFCYVEEAIVRGKEKLVKDSVFMYTLNKLHVILSDDDKVITTYKEKKRREYNIRRKITQEYLDQ